MLEVRNLEIEINNKSIIKNLNFTLNRNDKMAIIGEEGNGKSTLLKAIYHQENISYAKIKGSVNTKGNTLGYLEQYINDKDILKSVKEYLFTDETDYYNNLNTLYKILIDLDLEDTILDCKSIKVLSGGEKVKLQLLKILLQDPDILLLDEPTNDLDIKTLEWLESFINKSSKPIIFVSHDETLLDNTANAILHLEMIYNKKEPRNTIAKTNYQDYVNQRIRNINNQTQIARKERQNYKKQEEKLNQIMNKVEHQLRTISRSDPHGGQLLKKKMKSIKAQERRFDNIELTEIPDYEEPINFMFEEVSIPKEKQIIKLSLPKLETDNKILAKNINFDVKGNDHIVIIGKNGSGKTTLIKYIYKTLKDRDDIKVGYMPQEYSDILDCYKTPLDYLSITGDNTETALIRSYMGNMNFTKDEMTGDINNLSGGSKAKLILLKLIIDKSDVLILDEPTRNVSPLSNPIIRKALKQFKGTIISVSHDRKYIDEVCNKVYELNNEGLKLII